ncbi:MAG: polyamine aminopropyltransferase [Planctomycetota bacterium]
MKVIRTSRGARLVQGGLVLSEIVRRPGSTDSLFDVLAATIAALAPGPRVALLGFAGGGLVAPLRAMGYGHPIEAVDLDLAGERVFRDLSGPWAGRVDVHQGDAVTWLRRRRKAFDLILEDLSVPTRLGVTKPAVSLDALPALLKARTARRGIAVTNMLPVPGISWRVMQDRLARPWPNVQVVHVEDYENRVLLASRALPAAALVSRTLRRHLRAIGSDQAEGVSVRTLKA